MESKLKDPKNWTTRNQTQVLGELPMNLYYWQNVHCYHHKGECECRHKNDYRDSHVATVAEWLRGRESKLSQYDGHGFTALQDADNYYDWRSSFINYHVADESAQGTTWWCNEALPTEVLSDNKASFFVVTDVTAHCDGETDRKAIVEAGNKTATKIIRYVKKTLREYQESWGYDLHIENLQVAVVKHQTVSMGEETHLVFWFSKN